MGDILRGGIAIFKKQLEQTNDLFVKDAKIKLSGPGVTGTSDS